MEVPPFRASAGRKPLVTPPRPRLSCVVASNTNPARAEHHPPTKSPNQLLLLRSSNSRRASSPLMCAGQP